MTARWNRSIRNEAGFSLIELMIVVSIIGLLSSIAVPNYRRMTAKVRQSEAKSLLAAIYTAEKVWSGEHTFYTYCLFPAGYVPEESPRRYYTTGFIDGAIAVSNLTMNPDSGQSCDFSTVAWGGATRNDGFFASNTSVNPSATFVDDGTYKVTATTFKAIAVGSISEAAIADTWSIDDRKQLRNDWPGF